MRSILAVIGIVSAGVAGAHPLGAETSLVEQLEIGMSRKQVKFLLGTPAIVDLYRPDQWHYIYFLKTGDDGEIEKKRMTLTFSDDLLSKIEGDLNPG